MPGGTAHTAGGERMDAPGPRYVDVVRNLPADYYLHFYTRPCVRDSQLTAIPSGAAAFGLALILRSKRLHCAFLGLLRGEQLKLTMCQGAC